jgi:hypothetical protein
VAAAAVMVALLLWLLLLLLLLLLVVVVVVHVMATVAARPRAPLRPSLRLRLLLQLPRVPLRLRPGWPPPPMPRLPPSVIA